MSRLSGFSLPNILPSGFAKALYAGLKNLSWLQKILLLLFIGLTLMWLYAFADLFLGNPKEAIKSAMIEGKYASVNLKTGEIKGNIPKTVEDALVGNFKLREEEHDYDISENITYDSSSDNEEENNIKDDVANEYEIDDKSPKKEEKKSQEDKALKSAPNEKMIETTKEYGDLPRRDDHGGKPWEYYARPSDVPAKTPVIALVISNMGLSEVVTQKAINLDPDITISLTPYSREVKQLSAKIRAEGHELWLDLPMQMSDFPASDAGPLGLMKNNGLKNNIKNLKRLLGKVSGYSGLLGADNEVFSADDMMNEVYYELNKRGILMALRSRSFHPKEKGETIIYMNRHIGKDGSPNIWRQQLSALESISKNYGYAVGIVSPTPGALDVVHEWSSSLKDRNVALVPLSAIVERIKK